MKLMRLLILPLVLFATCISGVAQTVTGAVRGTITDSSGAIVANAVVTAINTATGVQTVAKTNGSGEYSIRFLQIGQYKLTVAVTGFETSSYGPFSLEIDQTAKVDVSLKVGAASTSVEVTDQMQPILDTESATLGETFTENTIRNIPLNGLDFSQLTVYTPGAVSTGFNSYGSNNSSERSTGAGNEVSVNGNRQQSNNYLLDGQEINENINNTLGYNPSPEALEQVRVIAANPNAEFGNVNGGTVIAAMKSGTNAWHGSVFGYLKNYKLDANSWANDHQVGAATPKNPYTATQFGGTFGGPIFHDRVFFFMDYLGFRTHTAGETTTSVAPAAFRTGDFSSLLLGPNPIQLYDTTTIDPATGRPVPYANNQIPITSPVAQYLFSNPAAYPLPNHAVDLTKDPTGTFNNFIGPSGSFATNDQGDVKVDWHFKSRDVMAFRYSQGYAGDGTTADPLPVQFPSASSYPDHLFDANWVHTFSGAIVNNFTASYGRIRFNSGVTTDPSGIFGLTGNQKVGIPSVPQLVAGFSSQNFSVQNSTGAPANFGANPTPEIFIDNIFGYSDNLTWQKGKHLMKFGAEFLRYQQNSFYPGNDGELGFFNYNGVYSSGGSSVSPFADFVLDRSNDVGVGAVTGRTGQRQWRDGVYAQDDWKIMPNLTINLGLRWEFDQPIYEVNNKQANLNLETATIEYAGVDGASRALYDATYTQFQPRVGFAYQVKPRLVVRGGYGISSYLEGTGANLRLTQNPPFHKDFEQIGISPTIGANGTYNPGTFLQAANGFPTTAVPTTTFYAWPKDLKPSVTQEFSLTTEYQVARNSTFQVGYVGILGHHLTDPYWGDQSTAPGLPGPYDNIVGAGGVLKITQTESASNYNALQAVFRQHLTAGFELTANYTYSKSLTDDIGFYGVSNIGSGQYYQQNAYDMRSEWGPSGMDTHHNISVTGVYDLPFGRGRRFGANMNPIINEVVGGWRLGGADVYYSGFPVTVSSPARYSTLVNAYTGAARPNQLRPLNTAGKSINAFWGTAVQNDPCAPDTDDGTCTYQQQSNSGFGALRPGSLRGPSFQNIDMSVSKTFSVFREEHLDFRADFFNAFNIADYAAPDSGMADGASFGQITGTINNNRSVQLLLRYVF